MLVIRFNRVGRHNHAQYRIIVQEKTKAPSGKHIAIVGSYDPHSKQTVLKEDMIKEFLVNGAQPSDSVYNLLVRNDVIKGEKRVVKLPEKKVEEKIEEEKVSKKEESIDTKEKDKKAVDKKVVKEDEKENSEKK
jgi:small subunit ribosomal protein S16